MDTNVLRRYWCGRRYLSRGNAARVCAVELMEIYLHDSAEAFEFVLEGQLAGDAVASLRHAWNTATSILNDKDVSVDVSALTAADAAGIELLRRMTGSGARLRAALPPQSQDFLRSLGVVVAAPPRPSGRPWTLGLRRLFGLEG